MKLGQLVTVSIEDKVVVGTVTGLINGKVVTIVDIESGKYINTVDKIVNVIGWLQSIMLFIQSWLAQKKI